MSISLASMLGLLLCLAPALVHAVEIVRPLWARWVVNWVLPFFGPGIPRPAMALTHDDQIAMLDAALEAAPRDKAPAGADYIFLLLFEQRQGALAFIAVATGVIYGLTLPRPIAMPCIWSSASWRPFSRWSRQITQVWRFSAITLGSPGTGDMWASFSQLSGQWWRF